MISNNSDFLFIYEAIQCNPNGDPDQENKPRMDYETNTNLVTDVRVKRYVRDYLKNNGNDIFVDFEGNSKVTMDDKLKAHLLKIYMNDEKMKILINDDTLFADYQEFRKSNNDKTIDEMIKKETKIKDINYAVLAGLVRDQFIDIRMFGSAFAVPGFTRAYTGPIQLNWGYSLNNVHLMESDTISSIMNDGNSTFGKDYRVKYSLLAFHGSINKAAAQHTGFNDEDLKLFRSVLWNSISANPTRSKLNQYPKLYVELEYNKDYSNGHFGDIRSLIKATSKIDDRKVRSLSDLEIDFSKLEKMEAENKGDGKELKELHVRKSPDIEISLENNLN